MLNERPGRPGLRLRSDRRRRGRGARAGADVRAASVRAGAGAAGAARGELRCSAAAGACRALAALLALAGSEAAAARRRPRRLQRLQGDLRAAAHAGRAQVAEVRSPRGLYALLDDFTERVDTDVSNNAGMLGCPARRSPSACIATATGSPRCRSPAQADAAYAPAALDALPYTLLPQPAVLLAGAPAGSACAGAGPGRALTSTALEPEPVLLGAVRDGLGPAPAAAGRPAGPALAGEPARAISRRATTWSTSPPTSWTPPRPTPTPSPPRRSRVYLRAPDAGRARLDPGLDPRFPGLRRPHAGHRARRRCSPPASPTRRRMSWSTAPPGTCASCVATRPGPRRASPRCAPGATTARSTCPTIPASTSRRRGPTSTTTCRRSPSTSGEVDVRQRARTTPSPTRPGRCCAARPAPSQQAFDLPPITLDRPFYYAVLRLGRLGHPAPAGDPAAGGDRPAGQPGGAGAGGGDRAAGAAGAAARAAGRRAARGPGADPARR